MLERVWGSSLARRVAAAVEAADNHLLGTPESDSLLRRLLLDREVHA